MNTNHLCSIISAGGLVGALALIPAAAIEPPPEQATPPAALLEDGSARSERGNTQRAEAKPSPFLGVATAEVPEMLADHLRLSDRSGVIVRTVVPDSPAEKAGLSVNDIITGLDGKPVADPGAFTAAINNRKPGDSVTVDLIHKGEPRNINIKLGNRPADATARIEPQPNLGGVPKTQADQLRGLFEGNLGSFGLGGTGAIPDDQFEETFRQMRERMNRAFGDDAGQGTGFQQSSTIRLMDDEGSVEIVSSKGDTEVKVRDKRNEIIWSGPWNTEEDKAAAPAEIRQRIDKVKGGGGTGFSFRFGTPGGDSDTIDN